MRSASHIRWYKIIANLLQHYHRYVPCVYNITCTSYWLLIQRHSFSSIGSPTVNRKQYYVFILFEECLSEKYLSGILHKICNSNVGVVFKCLYSSNFCVPICLYLVFYYLFLNVCMFSYDNFKAIFVQF